jgi:site-specific DNA-methyltransferase (adenine-specific)
MAQNEYMPMKYHEIISVFVNKSKPTFNKILSDRNKSSISRANYKMQGSSHLSNHINIGKQEAKQYNPNKVNPKSILEFKSVPNTPKGSKLHPTQKPVDLVEYLIKTYTNENETVLDFTMGSGTTGVACKNLNRNFIGIEMDDKYFSIAENRINNHIVTKELF